MAGRELFGGAVPAPVECDRRAVAGDRLLGAALIADRRGGLARSNRGDESADAVDQCPDEAERLLLELGHAGALLRFFGGPADCFRFVWRLPVTPPRH